MPTPGGKKKSEIQNLPNGSKPTTTGILIITKYTIFYVEPTSEFQSPFGIVANFMPNGGGWDITII